MEEKKSGLMPFCSSFNKNTIEERIEAIMRMKKATILSLGAAVIVIVGIATMFAASAAENRHDGFDYEITNFFEGDIDKDKESIYSDYITNTMASMIENQYEITACKIDVSYSNGEIVSADICVINENDETNALETDILDYVSKALGISTENIRYLLIKKYGRSDSLKCCRPFGL